MNYNNDSNWGGEKKAEWRCPVSVLLILLLVAIVATMLFTFNFTSNWVQQQDLIVIQRQQQTIDNLNNAVKEQDKLISSLQGSFNSGEEFNKLNFMASLFKHFSYYSNEFNKEEMLNEVLRAYAQATGDLYAEYYTEEEYAALNDDRAGAGVGIGVSVLNEVLLVEGYEYLTFRVVSIFKNAPAEGSGLLVGDQIYAIEVDGEYKSLAQIGGYTAALNAVRGEAGSTVNLLACRTDENGIYFTVEVSIVRNTYTKETVTYHVSQTDPSVGIVHIAEFDLLAPTQFKQAIKDLQEQGVQKFIFDVRNNPGGTIRSIKAVLSYILNENDLILSEINNAGKVDSSIYAGAAIYSDPYYSPCDVAPEEVGMFADLDMVILCNGNTGSAAEVFTASLRDHKNVTIVGETTYGKGILQRYISLSDLTGGAYDGYVKMTTHAYVTACGVTYHDIGISPTQGYEVQLSDEAKEYYFYLLPENLDNQLQKAIEAVNK